jgi:hypothetical protein
MGLLAWPVGQHRRKDEEGVPMKTKRIHIVMLLGLGLLATTASAQLKVLNGKFDNLVGMGVEGNWRHGVPPRWSKSGAGGFYTVNVTSGAQPPVANLQALPVLYQNVGTLSQNSDVVLKFDFQNPWGYANNRFSAVILAGSSVAASNRFDTLGFGLTLVASNVAAGASITVQFINDNPSAAPGLDNIEVAAYAVGTTVGILQQPATKTAMLPRTTAELSVSAFGVPPLTYQWRTNGVALTDATNATLTATSLLADYTVVVTGADSASVTSSVARLVGSVVNGDFSDMTGMSALGGGWYYGSVVGWNLADEIWYVLKNDDGATPPTLNLDTRTVSQKLGRLTDVSDVVCSFILSQPFNATAVTEDAFLMNGTTALASGRYSFTAQGQSTSVVFAVKNVSAGAALAMKFVEYSGGAAGLDNVVAAVFATNGPPLITSQPKAKNAMPDGTSATLSAAAFGVPPLAYSWLRNGAPVGGASSTSLTVTQTGDYRFVATAPNGVSATSDVATVVGSLVNGDFSDVTGMTAAAGGWYDGLPPGWNSTGHPTGWAYATLLTAGEYVCNPSQLNNLQQNAGTLLKLSHVTLRFDLPVAWNSPSVQPRVTARILNAATGGALATNNFGVGTGYTLKVLDVPGGTALKVEFEAFPGLTTALDNVSLTVSPTGTLISFK